MDDSNNDDTYKCHFTNAVASYTYAKNHIGDNAKLHTNYATALNGNADALIANADALTANADTVIVNVDAVIANVNAVIAICRCSDC